VQISILAVGKPGRLLEPAIREYEERAGRYWKLHVAVVKAERASRSRPVSEVQQVEAERLRAALPDSSEMVALTRAGEAWSSEQLAVRLNERAVRGAGDLAFLVGGAFGLHEELLRDARYRLSLSAMTMPHDLARLTLAEQLYRAGTIARGEPYHKG
jgi:23S rRNA (pseudouridine1915-N3)-methyltransferase